MAESIFSSFLLDVLADVVSRLAKLLIQEAAFLHGVRDRVESIKTELERMEAFLEDAESKRRTGDQRVEIWVRQIRDVAYEVVDIIDAVKFMAERQRQRRGFMGSFSRYCHKPSELISLHKIGSKIENIKEKIDGISKSTVTYGIANLGESGAEKRSDRDDHLQAIRQFPPHFFEDSTDVIGFENDKEKLVNLLVDPENKNRRVISIVGMGGLGKTTLARKLYNMAEVKRHFDTSVWLTISQKYDVKAILKDIVKKNISSVTEEKLETEEELKEKIYTFFRDKKYFVVLDDVWGVQLWERIGQIFPNKNNGSRVLLTTRNIEVARHAEPWIPPHELQLLNDTQSLELFRKKAFPPNLDVPAELDKLAQQLAKRCGGLPLALVVLGGLMSRKVRSYGAWSKVAESMQWESTGEGQQCLSILGLSYNDLPYPLKPCFLYIAAFPEDSTISASKLVRLWVAEDFILQEERQKMEDTARDWLDELVQRCMIQVVERSIGHGRVKSIRIHDLLRDFGLSAAKTDGFLRESDSILSHRVAFHNHINDGVAVSSPHLHTLLGFNLILKDSTVAGRFLNGLNLLRVLDLEGARYLKKLPKQIGNMIHLRYLGLRGNIFLKRLPSSVGNLLNLQTLDVSETEISWLPKSFWKIRTLRHLYINQDIFLTAPLNCAHNNLQTLRISYSVVEIRRSLFESLRRVHPVVDYAMYVINHQGIRFIKNWVTTPEFTKEAISKTYARMLEESLGKALEKMDSLVSLTVSNRDYQTLGDVLFAQPPILHHLRSLRLEGQLVLKQQQLPDSSKFPPNLTKLILKYSGLEQDPMPVLEKLPNLRLLELGGNAYVGKSMSCSVGGFPRLQHLILLTLWALEEWRAEVGAMPSLTHLTIDNCVELKMLPEGLQHVTTLRELELLAMPRAFDDRVRNEDGYKVRHIPSIIFAEFQEDT